MSWTVGLNLITRFTRCSSERSFSFFITMPFYAVAKGRTPGIFMTWGDCETQVKGFSGAKYKKFNTVTEAQEYIKHNGCKNIAKNTHKATNVKNASNAINNVQRAHSSSNRDGISNKAPIKRPRNSKKSDDLDVNDLYADEIDEELNKQMDAIEKRIKGVERNVNKIIKNSSGTTNSCKQTILIEPPTKKKRKTDLGFEIDEDGYVQVYTDGACSGNGRTCARAGLGVYWGDEHPLNTSEPVAGRATNNCGEIQAATKAINQALENGVTHLAINTDSKFLINSVTKWMPAWKRKGWKLKSGEPVKNEIDFKELDLVKDKLNIRWNYVTAHNGVYGNEMADRLAKDGAALYDK